VDPVIRDYPTESLFWDKYPQQHETNSLRWPSSWRSKTIDGNAFDEALLGNDDVYEYDDDDDEANGYSCR
jgi:hypothetical protein